MYHEIARAGAALCRPEHGYARYAVAEEEFRAHLEWIAARGMRGVPVGAFLEGATASQVVLTFDDGSETDLTVAAPLLERVGFGATFYVSAAQVGRRGYLSVPQLRELTASGFEVGSHGATHRYLDDLSPSDLRAEVVGSRDRLEQWLGTRVQHFSCPGGRYDARARALVRESGYRSMATSRLGLNPAGGDPYALRREPILRGIQGARFFALLDGSSAGIRQTAAYLRETVRWVVGNAAYDGLRARLLGDR